MSNRLSQQPAPASEKPGATGEVVVEAPPVEQEAAKVVKKFKFTPFTGDTDDLPDAVLNKKGRVAVVGAPRYYLRMFPHGYDLMAIFKNGKGTARRLVKVLKTGTGTTLAARARVAADKALLAQLKKAGVPVLD